MVIVDPIPSDTALAGSSRDITDAINYDYGYEINQSDGIFNTDDYQCECTHITDCINAAKNDPEKDSVITIVLEHALKHIKLNV